MTELSYPFKKIKTFLLAKQTATAPLLNWQEHIISMNNYKHS